MINVPSMSSEKGTTEAGLQHWNDFLMETVQESLTSQAKANYLWKQKGSIKNYFLVDDQLWKLKKRWVLSIILWDSFNLIEGPELSNLFNLLRSSQVPANKCPCDSRRYLGKQIFQMAVFRLDIRVPVEIPSVGYKLPSNGSLWFRPKLLYWHSSCPMEIPL